MTDTLAHARVPLHFRKQDAPVLLAHARWCEANGVEKDDTTLFVLAAKAANDEEPLVVACTSRDEVERIADLFTRLGIERPSIG